MSEIPQLRIEALSRKNWHHFEALFGEKGACGNCWCMYFRLKKAEFQEGKLNNGNKNAMKAMVAQGQPTGVIGFIDNMPVAWCAFAPREDYLKLANSRVHKPIDDQPVWSVTCFFVDKRFRRMGVSAGMLEGLKTHAKMQGVKIIEAYPTIPTKVPLPDSFAWIGLYKTFERAGFTIADQTSKNRPMVRYYIS